MMNLRIKAMGLQLLVLGLGQAQAQITYQEADAETMVDNLLSLTGGATASNEQLTGNSRCAGLFSNGQYAVDYLLPSFPDSGIVLSSGHPADLHLQTSDGITTNFGAPGDADLDAIVGGGTHDACVLTFDFECPTGSIGTSTVAFDYVWGSDEYNEYVNTTFNDVFAWFLNGANIALIPGTNPPQPVTIDTVNTGVNPQFFNNNDPSESVPFPNMEADGFTTTFTATGTTQNGPNHMKLAIADRGDHILDSWALIKEGSFDCNAPPEAVCEDQILSANADCQAEVTPEEVASESTDPDGDLLTFQFLEGSSPFELGDTDVTVEVSDGVFTSTCTATVTVVDTTPPDAECVPGPNPSGHIPPADNQDGFFTILGGDNCEEQTGITVIVHDTGSGTDFGPYSSGTNIKYVEAPGGQPREKPGPGVVDYMLTGNGDAMVQVTDGSGNTGVADCLVPPPPARRNLRGI